MSLVVVDGGESLALQYLVNKAASQNLKLCLFTNNKSPAEADVIGDYTEAAGSGYAEITLTGALGNVYGYFLKRATGGELVLAERFSDGPYNIQNNGDTITITLAVTAD